jgi:hypothetical protein
VGVIVNPYDRDRLTNQSKMRFFMAGPEYVDGAHYRKQMICQDNGYCILINLLFRCTISFSRD